MKAGFLASPGASDSELPRGLPWNAMTPAVTDFGAEPGGGETCAGGVLSLVGVTAPSLGVLLEG